MLRPVALGLSVVMADVAPDGNSLFTPDVGDAQE